MRRLPPLSSLRAFEAAARRGSFKLAANELGVTPTAISHQIRSLEDYTGVSLFERRTRLVVLTQAGDQLYPVVRDGFDAIAEILDHLAQRRRRSQITVSATPAFAAKWLIPRMSRFQKHHPDIDLQLHTSNEPVSLSDGNVDLAIRYGEGPYPGCETEKMFTDDFCPVVNPKLGVALVSDFAKVPLIRFEWTRKHPKNPSWELWFAQAGVMQPTSPTELRFSDESHAIQAAVAAQGIALLSLALVADELTAGQLVRPFPQVISGHTYHIVRSSDAPVTPALVATLEWLRWEIGSRER
jgi:LysR family glycine cleavage system transcriptional activator